MTIRIVPAPSGAFSILAGATTSVITFSMQGGATTSGSLNRHIFDKDRYYFIVDKITTSASTTTILAVIDIKF